jgi:curved DNA-binding protein CbpA
MMNLADCYQVLELKLGAPLDEVKAAYRRLARKYHPDVNSDDQSKEKFIAIAAAYQFLVEFAELTDKGSQGTRSPKSSQPPNSKTHPNSSYTPQSSQPAERPAVKVKVQVRQGTSPTPEVTLSLDDVKLKQSGYQQLQDLLKHKRLPRAVALVEGLAQRLPQDPEVKQWQAIAYQQMGRQLIAQKDLDKARIYLKKALKTDPHNRTLWAEVEKDFRYLEWQFKTTRR